MAEKEPMTTTKVQSGLRLNLLLAAVVFCGASLVFAGGQPKGIKWQDYKQATAVAKKRHLPVLVDFWRPG